MELFAQVRCAIHYICLKSRKFQCFLSGKHLLLLEVLSLQVMFLQKLQLMYKALKSRNYYASDNKMFILKG